MCKIIILMGALLMFSSIVYAQEPACGRATGFSYNQDTINRPYRLSGFFLKQNTTDIRITYGNSPELVEVVKSFDNKQLFICLDEYELFNKTYAGRNRVYAVVEKFRIWIDGELVYTE